MHQKQMAKERHLSLLEYSLAKLQSKVFALLRLSKVLQDLLQNGAMLLDGLSKDQNVINVDHDPIQVCKHFMH